MLIYRKSTKKSISLDPLTYENLKWDSAFFYYSAV